ncbi:MAG: hypothetical protein IAE91_04815 [Ignavibacteriaceae bacterium]|nr:hypothetical protein [Ignavibacteriaceae bacterium]
MEFLASIHPKVIHFPIALLVLYSFLELTGVLGRKEFFTKAAFLIFVIAFASTLLSLLTGNMALQQYIEMNKNLINVDLIQNSIDNIKRHEEYATWCIWYFGLLLVWRINLHIKIYIKKLEAYRKQLLFLAILTLPGLLLVYYVAQSGGYLVYELGIGTIFNR